MTAAIPNREPAIERPAFEQYAKPESTAGRQAMRQTPIECPAVEQCAKPQSTPGLARIEPSSLPRRAASRRGVAACERASTSYQALRVSSRRPCACRAAGDRSVEPPALRASSHRAVECRTQSAVSHGPLEPQRSPVGGLAAKGWRERLDPASGRDGPCSTPQIAALDASISAPRAVASGRTGVRALAGVP
jgi:hypothetical protein